MVNILATSNTSIDCNPPFSFYFDVIDVFWKAGQQQCPAEPSVVLGNSNWPLHRICTLARKCGAERLIIQDAASDSLVQDELSVLDEVYGANGSAEVIEFLFLRSDVDASNSDSEIESSFISRSVLINYKAPGAQVYTHSYIFSCIHANLTQRYFDDQGRRIPLLNNYVFSNRKFPISVFGKLISVFGFYYAQQNGYTNVCAHACLRMNLAILNGSGPVVGNSDIDKKLNLTAPSPGLDINQIESAFEAYGGHAFVYPCPDDDGGQYLQFLHSVLDSGYSALLVFTTNGPDLHIISVVGFTRNSDEWHPQAHPAYSGSSDTEYYASTAWIDHYIVSDDNFGPFYCLSRNALETDISIKPKYVIGIVPKEVVVASVIPEFLTGVLLQIFLDKMKGQTTCRWLEYICENKFRYVHRTVLICRDRYFEHLEGSVGHDGTAATADDLAALNYLPDLFWMVEFSLPSLYSGNMSKLGEFLFCPSEEYDENQPLALLLGARLPGKLVVPDASGGWKIVESSFRSHSRIYHVYDHNNEW